MLPRRLVTALLFLLAACCIWQSEGLAWGGGDAPDGTRYKLSPDVLVHVLLPHQTVSPTVTCAIDQHSQDPPPCELALRGGDAMRLLHAAYHTLTLAALFALLAAAIALLPFPAGTWSWVPGTAAILGLWVAIWAMETRPPHALAALGGVPYGIGGTKGMMEVALALLLLPVACVTGRMTSRPKGLLIEGTLFVALAALTLLALRFLYWPLVLGIEPPIAAGLFLFYRWRRAA